jgi:rod shape-determining protein MreC
LRTVAVGTGDMSRLKLPYLPTSADVIVGDLLVTSGLGGGFPPGYPVGTVAEVKRDPAQSLAEVEVKPAAALDRSRELMFVWLKPQPAAPAATPAAPPAAAHTAAAGPAPGSATVAPAAAAAARAASAAASSAPAASAASAASAAGANDE